MIDNISINKPSKALNFTFAIFGYVLAAYFVTSTSLAFEQKLSATLALGGILGISLFYIKPIERFVILLFLLSGKNIIIAEALKGGVPGFVYKKSAILFSPLLAEERARINGAFFFSISLLLSGKLLEVIGFTLHGIILLLLSVPTFLIAISEGYHLATTKIETLAYYYYFTRLGRPIKEIENAIKRTDWILASDLVINERYQTSILPNVPRIGAMYCFKCNRAVDGGSYCPDCGSSLIYHCKNCKAPLFITKDGHAPTYCNVCGKKLLDTSKQ